MPTPIFVLGLQRSGTTWLANQLANHSDIIGVTHPRHFGTHESCFFECVYGRYGDLSVKSNYIELAEVMLASNYFMLAGATRESLYELWPVTYEGVFRAVMDRYATAQGRHFWVEKTPQHTLLAEQIAEFYPDARFVGICRDLHSQLASALTLHPPRWRAKSIVVGVLRWHYYKAHLEFLEKTLGRCMLVDYNALRADSQQELMRVCEFLGIAFEPIMLQEQFERNTSFKGNDRPAVLFSRTEQWFIRGSRLAATMIPHFAMRMIHNWLKRRHKRQPFPVWFFDVERNDSLTE